MITLAENRLRTLTVRAPSRETSPRSPVNKVTVRHVRVPTSAPHDTFQPLHDHCHACSFKFADRACILTAGNTFVRGAGTTSHRGVFAPRRLIRLDEYLRSRERPVGTAIEGCHTPEAFRNRLDPPRLDSKGQLVHGKTWAFPRPAGADSRRLSRGPRRGADARPGCRSRSAGRKFAVPRRPGHDRQNDRRPEARAEGCRRLFRPYAGQRGRGVRRPEVGARGDLLRDAGHGRPRRERAARGLRHAAWVWRQATC